ncbi:hypothetical protein VNI00_007233 [Paramarasmius palmivorus]|uniref:protein-tyrosine-phosphatase n=1 Tax=Paramarasmius palmivorus TaxID=297713 RepID=A0AAW0D0D3_9AGAR
MSPDVMQAMCTPMHQVLSPQPTSQPSSPPQLSRANSSYMSISSNGSDMSISTNGSMQRSNSSYSYGQTGALYLGSLSAIQDISLLREHRIKVLIQVLDVPWMPQLPEKEFKFLSTTSPPESSKLIDRFEETCAIIDRALKSGESVLIHCQQGISRSTAILIAYLIRYHHQSYDSALAMIKKKRACVKPNEGFEGALRSWEGLIRGHHVNGVNGVNGHYGGGGRPQRPDLGRRFTS